MENLAEALLGTTRSAILGILLLRPEEALHGRELARMTGISPGTLHRELNALAGLGLLTRRQSGRNVYYGANGEHPIYEELAGLLRKTAGLVDVLRRALAPLAGAVDAGFVFGSMAAGTAGIRSDIDVMLLGDVPLAKVLQALAPAQESLRREINPSVMQTQEFLRRRKARDGFVSTVWKSPKLWLIGSKDDFV
jgi:DNA-binding transcriptional ArsR family regulator